MSVLHETQRRNELTQMGKLHFKMQLKIPQRVAKPQGKRELQQHEKFTFPSSSHHPSPPRRLKRVQREIPGMGKKQLHLTVALIQKAYLDVNKFVSNAAMSARVQIY